MRGFLAKYWFFVAIVLVVLLAYRFPVFGAKITEWYLLKGSIFVAFLITGLTLESRKIVAEIRNLRGVSTALVSCFILFPLVAVPLVRLFFASRPDFVVGVTLMSIAPVTIASGIILTHVAKGNVSLSLLICVACNTLAIFVMPLGLEFLLTRNGTINLPALQMIWSLVLLVLVPTLVGQVLRIGLKEKIVRFRGVFSMFSLLVVLLIIANAVSSSAGKITELGLRITYIFLFMLLLHMFALLMNFGLARAIRLDPASVSAFTIHVSQKTLTVTYVIWAEYFSAFTMAMIPSISYHLIQVIGDTFVAHRFREAAD